MNANQHLVASVGTFLVTAALSFGATIQFDACAVFAQADDGPNLAEMEAIEASLAVKETPSKQPQKPKRAPVPEVKPEGMSTDADRPPVPPKEDKAKKPDEDFSKQYEKFKRTDDDELEPGKPTEEVGSFDGSEFGFAEENKGDPFFQKLIADLVAIWEYPKILEGSGVPVGCMRLGADGKIIDINFKEKSGDAALDDSVERALATLKKDRNQDPRPVPTHLLKVATTRWTCFRFKL